MVSTRPTMPPTQTMPAMTCTASAASTSQTGPKLRVCPPMSNDVPASVTPAAASERRVAPARGLTIGEATRATSRPTLVRVAASTSSAQAGCRHNALPARAAQSEPCCQSRVRGTANHDPTTATTTAPRAVVASRRRTLGMPPGVAARKKSSNSTNPAATKRPVQANPWTT